MIFMIRWTLGFNHKLDLSKSQMFLASGLGADLGVAFVKVFAQKEALGKLSGRSNSLICSLQ